MCKSLLKHGGCLVSKIGMLLVVIGALNWGLYGLGELMGTNLNVVNLILGSLPTLENIVYILVGIAGIMAAIGCRCSRCMAACASKGSAKPMNNAGSSM